MDNFLRIIKSYQDLQVQIDMHEKLKDIAMDNKKYYLKQIESGAPRDITAIDLDGQPHGNYSTVTLDKAYDEIQKWEHEEYLEECEIAYLSKKKKEIENSVNKLKGLEKRVAFKRIFERNKDGSHKTLKQIAEELNYSLSLIKRINAKISKKIKFYNGRGV